MDMLQAIITGFIQGLTEFLPVSSSGHLVLTSSIHKIISGKPLSSGGSEEIFFDIMLHLGTLIAILIYFRKDIANLFASFAGLMKNGFSNSEEGKIPVYIAISTVATILVAFPMKNLFESLITNPAAVGIILIITGSVLFFTEMISDGIKIKSSLIGWKRAVIIGIAQGLAVAPGLSRSGSTIAAGLATGLDRVTCARFSFLLSVPIIIMAAAYESLSLFQNGEFATFNFVPILAGTLVSGIVGYFCIKYFIKFISSNKLNVFAIYCWVIGAGMFLYFGILT